jgi:hypothetical protein
VATDTASSQVCAGLPTGVVQKTGVRSSRDTGRIRRRNGPYPRSIRATVVNPLSRIPTGHRSYPNRLRSQYNMGTTPPRKYTPTLHPASEPPASELGTGERVYNPTMEKKTTAVRIDASF